MHVLVIGNHDPTTFGNQFEADLLASGWRQGAPQVTVEPFVFSHCGPGLGAVWNRHAAQGLGGVGTALVNACDSDLDGSPAEFMRTLAGQFFAAITSNMSRVVVALPPFLEPDAALTFLFELGALIERNFDDATCLQLTPAAQDLVLRLRELGPVASVESPARFLSMHGEQAEATQDVVGQLGTIIALVCELTHGVDVVGAYATNMPLMGMHGMSGASALEGYLEAEVAQQREREISEFFHVFQGPYAALESLPNPTSQGLNVAGAAAPSSPSLKDLTRHDGAGAGGGLGFGLLMLGARLLPAAMVFSAQFELREAISRSDVVVVYLETLDGRTFPDQVGHWAAQVAIEFISPVLVVTQHQIMSVREMSGQQVASAYVVDPTPRALEDMGRRLAKSWTPTRG